MSQTELHVVLGAGQVGPFVAEALLARGHRVRIVRRTPTASRVPGVENVSIDVCDASAVTHAVQGATVVYHCVNPAYDTWPKMLLPITRGIVDGVARAAGPRLVVLDNLYVYGNTGRMDENAPVEPMSRKGALRQQAAEYMLDQDARGAVRVAIGRASDFFGPHARQSLLGESFFRRAFAGKSVQVIGDPDQPHAYSYTPDVAAGLVALGAREDARGIFMLPVQPAESTRAIVARFARAMGRALDIAVVPTWVLRGLGAFQPVIRELVEMTYQWEGPFVVDDTMFRARFGFGPTPWDAAIEQTLAWARGAFAASAAPLGDVNSAKLAR